MLLIVSLTVSYDLGGECSGKNESTGEEFHLELE